MLATLSLSCGCTLGDIPVDVPSLAPRPGDARYCDYHGRAAGVTSVATREEPDESEPDPVAGCSRCGRPYGPAYHAIVGEGDAAEPLCLCPCGRTTGDVCDDWICRGMSEPMDMSGPGDPKGRDR